MRHAPHFLQWASAMELNPAACITTMQYSTKVAQERYRTSRVSADLEQVTFGNHSGGTSTTNITNRDTVKCSARQCDFSASIDCECRSVVCVCVCACVRVCAVDAYLLSRKSNKHCRVLTEGDEIKNGNEIQHQFCRYNLLPISVLSLSLRKTSSKVSDHPLDTARMFLVLTSMNAETANLIRDANLPRKLVPLRARQCRELDQAKPKHYAVASSGATAPRYK